MWRGKLNKWIRINKYIKEKKTFKKEEENSGTLKKLQQQIYKNVM